MIFVITKNKLYIDDIGYNIISKLRSNNMDKIVKIITNIGGTIVIGIVTIISLFIFRNKKINICIVLNLLGIVVLNNVIIKNIIGRDRPSDINIITEAGKSFPSGHSAVSMVVYGYLIYLTYNYIKNKKIKYLENKYNVELPKYEKGKGLAIGNLSSQFLAILYLSKLQHYITNNLHIKFINYMDDYVLIHNSKEYLKNSLELIENKINNEYKLKLNSKKTIISNSNQGISFLGYTFRVKNNKTIVKLNTNTKKNIRKGIKRSNYLYKNNLIKFNQYFSSIECFKNNYIFVKKDKVKHFIDRYNG